MKNKRIIYWGLEDERTIPKMAACGDGTDPAGGGGAGGGGSAGSGRPKPEKPKGLGKFPSLGDLLDKLKDLAPLLALGALGAAVIGGAIVFLRKNRDTTPEQQAAGDFGLDLIPPNRST